MNQIVLLILPFLSILIDFQLALAQDCVPWPGTYTPTVNIWDWRHPSEENWKAFFTKKESLSDPTGWEIKYLSTPFSCAGCSQSDQPNVVHLYIGSDDKDFQPSDGWELIFRSFGNQSNLDVVRYPTFALYNRHRGILRLFSWIEGLQWNSVNGGMLRISFATQLNLSSAALTHVNKIAFALDGFDVFTVMNTPNFAGSVPDGLWFMAEVPIAYDPCTCEDHWDSNTSAYYNNLSAFNIEARIITKSTIKLTGDITQDFEAAQSDGNAIKKDRNFNSIFDFRTLAGAAKKGISAFNDVKKITEFLVGKTEQTQDNSIRVRQNQCPDFEKEPKASQLPKVITSIVKAGVPGGFAAFSAIQFLMSGGEEPTAPERTVNLGVLNADLSGEIFTETDLPIVRVYTPGTKNKPQNNSVIKPVYDQVLGVLNLLETPVVEYVDYRAADSLVEKFSVTNTAGQTGIILQNGMLMPTIRQFRLKSFPKFALNPAAEVEIQSFEFALQFSMGENSAGMPISINQTPTYGQLSTPISGSFLDNYFRKLALYGPVVTKPFTSEFNHTQKINEMGFFIIDWPKASINDEKGVNDIGKITYSTAFTPASCFTQNSFMLAFHPTYENLVNGTIVKIFNWSNSQGNQPIVYLRIKVRLRRIDTNTTPSTEDIVFIATYPVKFEQSGLYGSDLKYGITIHNSLNCADEVQQNDPANSCQIPVLDPQKRENLGALYYRNYYIDLSKFTVNGNPGTAFPLGVLGSPYDLTISEITITENKDYYAINKITIGPNVTIEPSAVVRFTAGNAIDVDPDFTAEGNVTLELGLPQSFAGCEGVLAAPETPQAISTFCRSNNPVKYKPKQTNARLENNENNFYSDSSRSLSKSNLISLYPNPTTGMFTLQVGGGDGAAGARAVVWNALGQRVVPGVAVPESGRLELDLRTEAAGVYLVQVVGSTGAVLGSTRLAVQR